MNNTFLRKEDFIQETCPTQVDRKVLAALRPKHSLISRARVLIASGVMTVTACVFGYVLYMVQTPSLTASDEQFVDDVMQLFVESLHEVQGTVN